MSNERIIKGDDVVLNFTLFDNNKQVITNLDTALGIVFKIKNLQTQETLTYDLTDNVAIADVPTGKVAVTLARDITSLLDVGLHRIEVEVTDSANKKTSMRDENGNLYTVTVVGDF